MKGGSHYLLATRHFFLQVLTSCVGEHADMSKYVALQLAKSYTHAGNYALAEKQLLTNSLAKINSSGDGVMTVMKAQQLMTVVFLLKGDSVRASHIAAKALELSEGQDSSSIDISEHSTCYGLKGYR